MREQCFISRPPPPTPPRSHPATQASRGPRLEEGSARSRTISSKRVLDQRLHRSCHSGAPPISGLPEIGSVSAKSRLTPTFGAKRRRARCFETRTSCAPRHEGLVLRSEHSERLEGPGSWPPPP